MLRCSPVAAGVRDDYVVVFVNADHLSGRAETLKHAVGPATVTVLQRLHDLKVKVNVHLHTNNTAVTMLQP